MQTNKIKQTTRKLSPNIDKSYLTIEKILGLFPARIAVTDYCNLNCFFCSNEGMPVNQKNIQHIDVDSIFYLIKLLKEKGLTKISITGGEPSINPDICKIIDFINNQNFTESFFHTNGISLSEKIIAKLKNFSKIAVSIHAAEFDRWNRMTKGREVSHKLQHKNIELLAGIVDQPEKIEIKHVPIKGFNDSIEDIKATLDLCSKFGFKFKFLNFEPITPDQLNLSIDIREIRKKLVKIGCNPIAKKITFRGQCDYLPIEWFEYKKSKGVLIEIGCGLKNACLNCYKSNEIFINPQLEIKPCHVSNKTFSLLEFIKERKKEEICNAIVESRVLLATAPGLGNNHW